jgi:hypothetical protein
MILFTNIASVVIDNVKNCLHVSGEITDTVTNKVFSFRGKATVMDATDQLHALNTIKQIQEQTTSEKLIVTETHILNEEENKPVKKMTYDNLWKF